jgi:hypothetical protein
MSTEDFQTRALSCAVWHSCINCDHWSNNSVERKDSPPTELCHKWRQRPPASVIVVGCPEWQDAVPF